MTRFARAKGSKASNERIPDEPTPWHVMKQQMQEAEAMKNSPKEKTKTVKELLKTKDADYISLNTPTDWAEFEPESKKETTPSKERKWEKDPNVQGQMPKLEKINENEIVKSIKIEADLEKTDGVSKTEKILSKRQKRKLERANQNENVSKSVKVEADIEKTESVSKAEHILSKRQKRNRKNKLKNSAEGETNVENGKSGGFNVEGNDWKTDLKFGKRGNENEPNRFQKRDRFRNGKAPVKRKPPKVRDYDQEKEFKRKKPIKQDWKMNVNGIEVDVSTFDGFSVKKEDAERLKDLRKQMHMKGIPKKEVEAALKLERRKAEKALVRLRKTVCFHCRKAGHSFSDCPDMNKEEIATGICFKCGSTEHTHFECKVAKKEEFRFAKCFICREQGHVAKQCPDNPKGLYPNGGSCKICGDVTHLKKDCPDLQKEKEESTITLSTLNEAGNAVEALDGSELKKITPENVKCNKIIKF